MNRRQEVRFPAGGLSLEGVLHLPDRVLQGAVVCHPHPLHGGSMDNPVVLAVTEALVKRGAAVLRFNFRGTGGSAGVHAGGVEEQQDVEGALDCLIARGGLPGRRLSVFGYSFGARVGAAAGAGDARVHAIGLIAPPLAHHPIEELRDCRKPKLLVVGDRDPYAPLSLVEAWYASLPEPKRKRVLDGVDHFFASGLADLGEAVADFAGSLPE